MKIIDLLLERENDDSPLYDNKNKNIFPSSETSVLDEWLCLITSSLSSYSEISILDLRRRMVYFLFMYLYYLFIDETISEFNSPISIF
jgi:hypothetical protein